MPPIIAPIVSPPRSSPRSASSGLPTSPAALLSTPFSLLLRPSWPSRSPPPPPPKGRLPATLSPLLLTLLLPIPPPPLPLLPPAPPTRLPRLASPVRTPLVFAVFAPAPSSPPRRRATMPRARAWIRVAAFLFSSKRCAHCFMRTAACRCTAARRCVWPLLRRTLSSYGGFFTCFAPPDLYLLLCSLPRLSLAVAASDIDIPASSTVMCSADVAVS